MQTKIEITTPTSMICKKHNRIIQCLNLSNSTPTFLCVRCLLSNSYKSLEIQEIQECSESHVFEGWPFKDDQFSKKVARTINNESENQDQLDQQQNDQQTFINSTILQIQNDFIQAIEKQKQAFIDSASVLDQEKTTIMHTYNQITKKAKLKELLELSTDQLLENEPALRSLLSETIKDADKNEETLQNQIEQHDRKLEELSIPSMKKALKIAIQEWVKITEFLEDDRHEQDDSCTKTPQQAVEESEIQETPQTELRISETMFKEMQTQNRKQADLISKQSKKIIEQENVIKQSKINQQKLKDELQYMRKQPAQKEETKIITKQGKKKISSNNDQYITKNGDSDELIQLKSDFNEKINTLKMEAKSLNNQLLDSESRIKQLERICSNLEKQIPETQRQKGCGTEFSHCLYCNNPLCSWTIPISRMMGRVLNGGGKDICGEECSECRKYGRKGMLRCGSAKDRRKVQCPHNYMSASSGLAFQRISFNENQTQKGDQFQFNKQRFSYFNSKK